MQGYAAIGLTDHVGVGSLKRVITELTDDCALAQKHWNIMAIPGVELTHLPPAAIADAAYQAKKFGARLVIVHGESPAEPVIKGTNLAAVQSSYVDILAHPGRITEEEAFLAARNGVFLELTSRHGHSETNNHVGTIAGKTGALLLMNSDSHDESDLLTGPVADKVLRGAGLDEKQLHQVLELNPLALLKRVGKTSH